MVLEDLSRSYGEESHVKYEESLPACNRLPKIYSPTNYPNATYACDSDWTPLQTKRNTKPWAPGDLTPFPSDQWDSTSSCTDDFPKSHEGHCDGEDTINPVLLGKNIGPSTPENGINVADAAYTTPFSASITPSSNGQVNNNKEIIEPSPRAKDPNAMFDPEVFGEFSSRKPDYTPNGTRRDLGPKLPLPTTSDIETAAAYRLFRKHMRSRMPYVLVANARLQSVLGFGNDVTFADPGQLGTLLPVNGAGNLTGEAAAALGPNPGLTYLRNGKIKAGILKNSPPEKQKLNMGPEMSWGERKGLREALVKHGMAAYGKQVNIDMLSISFHDLTPDPRTGAFKNELLGHYEVDKTEMKYGPTISMYEVNVPLPRLPTQRPKMERWLHIRLQTPFLTSPEPHTCTPLTLPFGLESPAPLSWVVIAAPLSHITSHSTIWEPLTYPNHSFFNNHPKCVVKRRDYDLGPTTKFEFMDKLGWNRSGQVGPERDYRMLLPRLQQEVGVGARFLATHAGTEEGAGDGSIGNSEWYSNVVEGLKQDAARWERVRKSVASGHCRIIVRQEFLDHHVPKWARHAADERGKGARKMVLRSAARKGRSPLSREVDQ